MLPRSRRLRQRSEARNQAQDVREERPRHGDLSQLEHEVAAMPYHHCPSWRRDAAGQLSELRLGALAGQGVKQLSLPPEGDGVAAEGVEKQAPSSRGGLPGHNLAESPHQLPRHRPRNGILGFSQAGNRHDFQK